MTNTNTATHDTHADPEGPDSVDRRTAWLEQQLAAANTANAELRAERISTLQELQACAARSLEAMEDLARTSKELADVQQELADARARLEMFQDDAHAVLTTNPYELAAARQELKKLRTRCNGLVDALCSFVGRD